MVNITTKSDLSVDVQIGVYTEKIMQLEEAMKNLSTEDPGFRDMRYTLLRYVGERRKLLHYLEVSNYGRYRRAMELIRKEGRAA